jgi:tRNA (guanine-N7-)-methyltransferase
MRKIQSFVKRSGRLTISQQNALTNFASDFIIKEITKSTFENDKPIILEIGFGNGDSLFEMAKNEPENNFIGIEVYEAGVGRLLNNASIEKLTNLKLLNTDAVEILQNTPDDYLSGFQLYFPDPWHKKRHNKRRIVNTEFLNLIAKKIKNDGFVHMATDWEEYAFEMLEELSKHNSFKNTTNEFSEKPIRRPTTKFERRGQKLGHGVWDLVFIKSEKNQKNEKR